MIEDFAFIDSDTNGELFFAATDKPLSVFLYFRAFGNSSVIVDSEFFLSRPRNSFSLRAGIPSIISQTFQYICIYHLQISVSL